MNIMLVDTDKDNIKNFRTYIRRSFSDFKISGSFTDPDKDIMPAIRDMKPDLIIADIKFFGGVRFMRFKEVHEEFPDLRFIVYGTFNESEYMRRARDFGVIDYMYRPVKPVELSRCLNLALGQQKRANQVREQVKQQKERYHDNISHYEGMFLRGLAEGHIHSEDEIMEGFTHFDFKLAPDYSVAVVHIDHFRQIALTLTESEKHLLIYNIYQIVSEAMLDSEAICFMMSFHSIAVLMGGSSSIEDKVSLFDNMKQIVFDKTNTRVSIGLGRNYNKIAEVGVSYKEALAAFRYRFRMGYNSVIPLEFVEGGNRITYRYPAEREERLIYMAVVGDYQYCHHVLLELFDALAQSGPMPEGLLPKILMNIIIRISRYISEQNLPLAKQVSRLFPTAEILAVQNLEEGLMAFDNALKNFCAYVRNYTEENHQRLFRSAKQYVDRHYTENFSTAKMAVTLGTTPEHLNKVFTDRERVNLFDYVMRVRMTEVRRMLSETEMEEEDICVKVGFEDVKYFRSIFKQYEGRSPAEFREELNTENTENAENAENTEEAAPAVEVSDE